jgi:GST-like protein
VLKFYYHPSPNPAKVALFREESGLPYEVMPVDTRKGEQFSRAFNAINPNNKTPAIEDGGVHVFDSNAILLYLAEKTGKFLPEKTLAARGELLSWMMFIATGIGPYSGQAVHFKHCAPKGLDYAVDRYLYEARRHYVSSTRNSAKRHSSSAAITRSRISPLGGGYERCRSYWARMFGALFRTSRLGSIASMNGRPRSAPMR